jgi:phage head maturation protease
MTIRELLDIEFAEISVTAFLAYPQTDVSVAQRSLQAFQKNQLRNTNLIAWLRLQERVR